MRLVPGSHRFSGYVRGWGYALEEGPVAAALSEIQARAVSIPLQAGEALIWNPGLVHASHANEAEAARVVLSVTLAQPDAEFIQPVAISGARGGLPSLLGRRPGRRPARRCRVGPARRPDWVAVAEGRARSFADVARFVS